MALFNPKEFIVLSRISENVATEEALDILNVRQSQPGDKLEAYFIVLLAKRIGYLLIDHSCPKRKKLFFCISSDIAFDWIERIFTHILLNVLPQYGTRDFSISKSSGYQCLIKILIQNGILDLEDFPNEIHFSILPSSFTSKNSALLANSAVLNRNLLNSFTDLSVLVFSYNQESWLKDCLESILMQDNLESVKIVLHDDASTDRSTTIIRQYCDAFPELFCAILQNENVYAQGNSIFQELIGISNSAFICRLDADDFWINSKAITQAISILKGTDAPFVYGDGIIKNERDDTLDLVGLNVSRKAKSELVKHNILGNRYLYNTVFFRNAVISFPEDFESVVAQDWYLWSILTFIGEPIKFGDNPISVYRVHGQNYFAGTKNSRYINDLRSVFALSSLCGKSTVVVVAKYLLGVKTFFLGFANARLSVFDTLINLLIIRFIKVERRPVTLANVGFRYEVEPLKKFLSGKHRIEGCLVSPISLLDAFKYRSIENARIGQSLLNFIIKSFQCLAWYYTYKQRSWEFIYVIKTKSTRIAFLNVRFDGKSFNVVDVPIKNVFGPDFQTKLDRIHEFFTKTLSALFSV